MSFKLPQILGFRRKKYKGEVGGWKKFLVDTMVLLLLLRDGDVADRRRKEKWATNDDNLSASSGDK